MTHTAEAKLAETNLAIRLIRAVLLCAPLTVRARSRTLCFALVAGVALAQWLTSSPQIADVSVLVALYWLALDGPLAGSSQAVLNVTVH